MRVKIILPNLLIVVLLGIASYFYLNHKFTTQTNERMSDNLTMMKGLFERTKRLSGYDMLNEVIERARTPVIANVFAPLEMESTPEETRREQYKRAFIEVEAFSEYWKEEMGRKPELVVITDQTGVAMARTTDPNACPVGYNLAKHLPDVAKAVEGQARRFVWSVEKTGFAPGNKSQDACEMMGGKLLDTVVAPIYREGQIVGSLLVGYDLSKGLANEDSSILGVEVGYLELSDVYSSSLDTDVERQELASQIKGPLSREINRALTAHTATEIMTFSTGTSRYLGIAAPLPGVPFESGISYILFLSIDKAHAPIQHYLNVIFILLGVAVLLVFIVGMMLSNHFQNPVEQIEEGLLRVINGDHKYRFEVRSAEVGGLCYRINQLIGALTGEDEEGEEDTQGGAMPNDADDPSNG